MVRKNQTDSIRSELKKGINLAKCRKCGCMKETLEGLRDSLTALRIEDSSDLVKHIEHWLNQMESIKYACLGCEHCYPAVAMNVFNQAFPETASQASGCSFEVREHAWPPVPGEYFASCGGTSCPVAISTLSSIELAERLSQIGLKELCIVGKTETENIGIDKIIKNTITNPTIHFLLLAGKDPEGHRSGGTLLSLWENGVDENMRVIDSPGKHPVLRNVTREEVEAFRKQIQIVNMIGCEDVESIVQKLKDVPRELKLSGNCSECDEDVKPLRISFARVVCTEEPERKEIDKAGYFVIIPQPQKGIIIVEHYSYNNRLLRAIEGRDAGSIYRTIIKNGWVTQLSHAAYLGKELAKAELSIKLGFRYVQEGA